MPNGKPRDGVAPNRLESKARCDALIKATQNYSKMNCPWLFAGGYTKKTKCPPIGKDSLAIADQMNEYVISHGYYNTVIPEYGWGTYEETEIAIRQVNSITVKLLDPPTFFVSTNLGHMPRVWLCWFFLKPKGWKVHFVLAKHSFTPKEWGQETVKFFTYLYRFVFKKWGNKTDDVGEHRRAFR